MNSEYQIQTRQEGDFKMFTICTYTGGMPSLLKDKNQLLIRKTMIDHVCGSRST